MSGYTQHEALRRGNFLGGEDLVQKPFSPDELAAAVRAALDRPRSVKVEREARPGEVLTAPSS